MLPAPEQFPHCLRADLVARLRRPERRCVQSVVQEWPQQGLARESVAAQPAGMNRETDQERQGPCRRSEARRYEQRHAYGDRKETAHQHTLR